MKGSLGILTKDPNEALDFVIDWTAVLASSETISSATWSVPTGVSTTSSAVSSTTTTLWCNGGTAGKDYVIGCAAVTNQNRIFDRSFVLKVEQK